jgi:hypothetical protein
MEELLQSLKAHREVDREELNILWWFYRGASTHLSKPLEALTPGAAAVSAGAELGEVALLPPLAGMRDMAAHAVRNNDGGGAISAEQLVSHVSDDVLSILPRRDEKVLAFTRQFPAIFPVAWLFLRLRESKRVPGWAGEYRQLTGRPATEALPIADWARHVFDEITALRWLSR